MALDRDLLYNTDLPEEDTVLSLMGLPIAEGFDPGDLVEVAGESLKDSDTGLPIPDGVYSVSSAEAGLVSLVQYNPVTKVTGGREYTVHDQDLEQAIFAGDARFKKHLGEGRYRGSVDDPRQIRAMFVKGHLRKKKDRPHGGTSLQYSKVPFKKFQSGNPNPQFQRDIARRRRAARKEDRPE